jgi:hypothetical protein
MDRQQLEALLFSPVYSRPQNMIWAQIMILDVFIHFLIHGGWLAKYMAKEERAKEGKAEHERGKDEWGEKPFAVLAGIVNSWHNPFQPALTSESQTSSTPQKKDY